MYLKKYSLLFMSFTVLNGDSSFVAHEESCFQKTCFKIPKSCSSNNKSFTDGDTVYGKTFFSYRPQDSNTVYDILSLLDPGKRFNFTFAYQKSFNTGSNLANWFLFSGSNCMSIGVPGDNVEVDADGSQMGLSLGNNQALKTLNTGVIGEFCLSPEVENFIFKFDYNFRLDEIACGLWGRISAPVVRTETKLNTCTKNEALGTDKDKYPKGLFVLSCDEVDVPYITLEDALEGDKGFGEVGVLNYSKFPKNKLSKTGLAGLHFNLGYDICRSWDFYLAVGGNLVVPTGNRPNGNYLLEPVVGANHSWQLGGFLELYKNWERDCLCGGIYFYGTINHLFKARQTRTFTLKNNGAGSQLMLLKRFNPTTTAVVGLDRVADVLSGEVKVGTDFMLDASIMLHASYKRLFGNIGYNFWLRTKEKTGDTVCFRGFQDDRFGVKGNTKSSDVLAIACPGADVCKPNVTTSSSSTISSYGPTDGTEPKLLTCKDIDFSAPLHPLTSSNKIFGTVGLNFELRSKYVRYWLSPLTESCKNDKYRAFAAVTGEVEFGNDNTSLSQWSIVSKVGLEF